jgi:hypothetical protein
VLIKTALLLVACHCAVIWCYSLDIREGKITLLLLLLILRAGAFPELLNFTKIILSEIILPGRVSAGNVWNCGNSSCGWERSPFAAGFKRTFQ